MESDEELLRRAASGEDSAFEKVLAPTLRPALELAYVILGSPAAAEDAVQEAAVTAWRKRAKLKPELGFRGWFLTIVANQCKTQRRSAWTRLVGLSEEVPVVSMEQEPVDIDLVRALNTLSVEERATLALHYYLDFRIDEVAAILGLSRAGAKSRVHRSLKKLSRILRPGSEVGTA